MPKQSKYKRRGNLKKYIKSVVAKNIETNTALLKFNQTQVGVAGPVIASFNDLKQGDSQSERQGNQITMTSIKWDLFFAGSDTTNSYRIIVYIPREPSVLITALPFNGAVDYDQHIVLKDTYRTTSLNGNNAFRLNGYHSFRNKGKSIGMKTQWASSGVNDQTKGRVCLYVTTDSAAVPNPEMNGTIRTFYKDA